SSTLTSCRAAASALDAGAATERATGATARPAPNRRPFRSNCRRVDGEAGKCSIIVMIFFLIAVRGPAHFDPHHRGRGLAPMRSAVPSPSLFFFFRFRDGRPEHFFLLRAPREADPTRV